AEHPAETTGVAELEEIHQQGGRDAEGDDINERVEFGAEAGAGIREPGDATIECVEHAREDDEPAGPEKVAVIGGHNRPETEEEIAEGKCARHHDDDTPHAVPRCGTFAVHFHSAITVTPAWVTSPCLTRMLVPAGTNTSTREPKR